MWINYFVLSSFLTQLSSLYKVFFGSILCNYRQAQVLKSLKNKNEVIYQAHYNYYYFCVVVVDWLIYANFDSEMTDRVRFFFYFLKRFSSAEFIF